MAAGGREGVNTGRVAGGEAAGVAGLVLPTSSPQLPLQTDLGSETLAPRLPHWPQPERAPCSPSPPSKGAEETRPSACCSGGGGALNLGNSLNSLSARCLPLPTEPGWQAALPPAVWQDRIPSHPDHSPRSGYHRLKEGAVPTIFESFSKLRRTKTKRHGYPPGPPEVSRLRRCRKRYVLSRCAAPEGPACRVLASSLPGRGWEPVKWVRAPCAWPSVSVCPSLPSCSEGPGPTAPFSPPPPADVACFPVEEASAPAALSASPAGRLEPGLSSPFSDLLGPLGAQADEAGCSAQPSPERQPSPLEPRPVSPSAYMLRLPPPAGAYIQSEHSYQVGSALLWKRRAEAALDALDKAQRQLQACKRREQRLRLRLTKLQQERAREKRAQADARQTLKEHVQDFAMQLSNSMA